MVIETKRSAAHEVAYEEAELFIYRFGSGEVTGDDIATLSEVERTVWDKAYIYSITSLDDGLSILPGALTRAAKIYQHSPPRTSAFIVRRHYLRTSMEFLVRTLRLVGAKVDARFFEDEASARLWIATRQAERANV